MYIRLRQLPHTEVLFVLRVGMVRKCNQNKMVKGNRFASMENKISFLTVTTQTKKSNKCGSFFIYNKPKHSVVFPCTLMQ